MTHLNNTSTHLLITFISIHSNYTFTNIPKHQEYTNPLNVSNTFKDNKNRNSFVQSQQTLIEVDQTIITLKPEDSFALTN